MKSLKSIAIVWEQLARRKFLANFFNVKSDWDREWSDYIYFSLTS